jgi:HTH-type transcriptional regulator / antitoxin HigA
MGQPKPLPVDHPGTFIQEEIEARNWQQVDLAFILGMSPQQLSPILTGKQSITPELAIAFGDAFTMPADFFANLQKMYDLYKAKPVDPGVKKRAAWQAHFPMRDMIKRGWIEDGEPELLDLQMMRFFGKNRIEDIPFIGTGQIFAHAARKAAYDSVTPPQYAWLHRVMKIAEAMDAPLYSDEALRKSLPKIKAHLQDKDDLIHIPEILRKCGVRYTLVEALPASKIDGVCVWIDGQPAIGMTLRLDRLDNFAFVLRHEIEHVLNRDGVAETFWVVDEKLGPENEPEDDELTEERLANAAAAEFCVPGQALKSFIARKSPFISEQDVLAFAARNEIHPAIVVGQIQHLTKKYGWLRKYQTSIKDHLFDWQYKDGWGHTAPTGL